MTIHGRLVHRSLAIVATAVGIAAALLIGRATGSPDRAQSQVDNVIRPASEWVPLAIEYSIHDDMTGVKHYVVEYRAGDGSTRNEQVSDLDSRPMIRIDNLTTGKHYSSKEGQWLEHPLRTQRNSGKPFTALDRRTVAPVPPSDPRVAVFATVPMTLSFYEFRAPSGNVAIFCPELNMRMVWAKYRDGKVQETTRVTLGIPPDVAFAPPAAARVIKRSQPAGTGSVDLLPSQRPKGRQ